MTYLFLRKHHTIERRKIRPGFSSTFFAVATEEFFDRPLALLQHTPDHYRVLSDYCLQKPARSDRRDGVSG